MKLITVGMMVVGAAMLSGCASMQASTDHNRLQSHVELLDERVTQLERFTSRQPAMMESEIFAPDAGRAERDVSSAVQVTPAIKPSTREIQQALNMAGFYQGAADGKMGPMTREAIRQFQEMNDLKIDGIVGKRTWAVLSAFSDASVASGELGAAEILK